MKRCPSPFTLLALYGAASLHLASADTTIPTPVEERIATKVNALNTIYIGRHLEPIHLDVGNLKAEEIPSLKWSQGTFWHIYVAPSTFVDCDSGTGFPNAIIRDDLVEKGTVYGKKPVPNWSSSRAVFEAKPWIHAFLGYLPQNLGRPQTQFNFDEGDTNQYYDGYWIIVWPRIDARGYPFEKDDLVVQISEKYGLTSCALYFDSDYKEAPGQFISKGDGISKAGASAAELVKKFLPNATLGPSRAELRVVNLNNLFEIADLNQLKAERTARLAWRIEFSFLSDASQLRYHALVINIDALTGEVLGGNLK